MTVDRSFAARWRDLAPLRILEIALFTALVLWLFAAAWVVDVEPYDGLDTIVNAAHFLGEGPGFSPVRGPLMGMIMVAPRWIKSSLGLDPLDLRPFHLTMACLHSAFLLGVYVLLCTASGRSWATFLAFSASVPTFIFFSYAIFISHDLLPGIFLLAMLIAAERGQKWPFRGTWIGLVIVGAIAALVKHTYALFWVVILIAQLIPAARTENLKILPEHSREPGWFRHTFSRHWFSLLGAAATSAVITWIVLSFSLLGNFPDVHVLLKPAAQIKLLLSHSFTLNDFPVWLYIRNFTAYGLLPSILVVPAIVSAFRKGSDLLRHAAVSWVLIFGSMHLVAVREVRYLAMLAPITALLLVPLLRWLLTKRAWTFITVSVLVAGLAPPTVHSPIAEAANAFCDEFRSNQARSVFARLGQGTSKKAPVFINWKLLTFVGPMPSPLVGDRYHRMFHFGAHHLETLFDYSPGEIIFMDEKAPLRESRPLTSAMVLTNSEPLCNPSNFKKPRAPQGLEAVEYQVLLANESHLKSKGSFTYSRDGIGKDMHLLVSQESWLLTGEDLWSILKNRSFPLLRTSSGQTFPLEGQIFGPVKIHGMLNPPRASENLIVEAFLVTDRVRLTGRQSPR